MNQQVILELKNIIKLFPQSKDIAVDDVSLSLHQGDLLGLVGPSGCGKTTLLRIIAGFENLSQGKVSIAGQLVSDKSHCLPPEKRNTGMVFQDYALFPHLTVRENIAYGLKKQKTEGNQSIFGRSSLTQKQIKFRVREILELVGLEGVEKRYPHQLSGGQQQRISLARALAPQPALILLDEPLSNLDAQIRHRLRAEIRSILKAANTSAIFVTHDREEALAISDQIAVMRQGKLEQIGMPETVYSQPNSPFVAEFVTQANFLPANRIGQVWETEIGTVPLSTAKKTLDCDRANLMLRQEDIELVPDEYSGIVVTERQFLGREYFYSLATPSGQKINARTTLSNVIEVGTKVSVSIITASKVFPFSSW
ncbi:ABC transporter ATP-binding protein [Pleurocapsa sp. PCC 7319]|uniref:ABC transporter ATP-binding protein n=1 Tax=Pleurocapsa sp. PCC 7319 TaxID=118161 RepID=UPI000349E6F9|nr:ABC transporter ATP-binding protein [Pleurocapsa sp. PCC 7319]